MNDITIEALKGICPIPKKTFIWTNRFGYKSAVGVIKETSKRYIVAKVRETSETISDCEINGRDMIVRPTEIWANPIQEYVITRSIPKIEYPTSYKRHIDYWR